MNRSDPVTPAPSLSAKNVTPKGRLIGGVVVPLVSPITKNGNPDFDGVARLSRWLVAKGVQGIFVGSTTGRFSHFTPEQNAEICRAVVDAVGEQVTIYGGICDSGLKRMLSNAELMQRAGAEVVVATGPYYLSRLIQEAEADLSEVALESPLPVIFYNIPEFVGYGLRPEWIREMAESPKVVGYKDSSDNLEHHLAVLERTRGKDFSVFIGKELLLSQALQSGASGIIVSLLFAAPEPFLSLVQNVASGDRSAAAENQGRIAKLVEEFVAIFRKRPVFSTLMSFLEDRLRQQGVALKLI
jgi:4-hydroxy-tetrahydrodipicolinate synthase